MAINIPKEYQDEIRQGWDERVSLPFDAPFMWWKNGAAAGDKNGSGVQHYGGWVIDAASLEAITDSPPARFVKEPHYNRNGEEYIVYATRYIGIAPIGRRSRWVLPEDGRGKGTSNVQYLALLADYKDKQYKYWMPAVITLKGYSALMFDRALGEFDRQTAKARRQYANGASALFFWRLIGTFGKERNQKMVGAPGLQSPITPPVLFVPSSGWETEEALASCFVGKELLDQMLELKRLAKEWLEDWKQSSPQPQHNGVPPQPDDTPLPSDEDVPF